MTWNALFFEWQTRREKGGWSGLFYEEGNRDKADRNATASK